MGKKRRAHTPKQRARRVWGSLQLCRLTSRGQCPPRPEPSVGTRVLRHAVCPLHRRGAAVPGGKATRTEQRAGNKVTAPGGCACPRSPLPLQPPAGTAGRCRAAKGSRCPPWCGLRGSRVLCHTASSSSPSLTLEGGSAPTSSTAQHSLGAHRDRILVPVPPPSALSPIPRGCSPLGPPSVPTSVKLIASAVLQNEVRGTQQILGGPAASTAPSKATPGIEHPL